MSYKHEQLLVLTTNFEKLAAKSLEKEAAKKDKKVDPKAKVRNRGTVCVPAESAKDKKDHFPINDEAQARNALARVNQFSSVPEWYSGSLQSLVSMVARKVHSKYPGIKVSKDAKKPGKKSAYYDGLLNKFAQEQLPKDRPADYTVEVNEMIGHFNQLKDKLKSMPSYLNQYSKGKGWNEGEALDLKSLLDATDEKANNLTASNARVKQYIPGIQDNAQYRLLGHIDQLIANGEEFIGFFSRIYKTILATGNPELTALANQKLAAAKRVLDRLKSLKANPPTASAEEETGKEGEGEGTGTRHPEETKPAPSGGGQRLIGVIDYNKDTEFVRNVKEATSWMDATPSTSKLLAKINDNLAGNKSADIMYQYLGQAKQLTAEPGVIAKIDAARKYMLDRYGPNKAKWNPASPYSSPAGQNAGLNAPNNQVPADTIKERMDKGEAVPTMSPAKAASMATEFFKRFGF